MTDQNQAEPEVEAAPVLEPSYPLDSVTRTLLGIHLAETRTRREISQEGMVQNTIRTEEWFAAVEAGRVDLTEALVLDIGAICEKRSIEIDVEQVLAELQQQPFGAKARRLRLLAGSGMPINSPDDLPAPPASLTDALSPADRLLVVTPVLVLASLLMLCARTLVWATAEGLSENPLLEFIDKALIPAALIGTLFAVLAACRMNSWFHAATNALRSPVRQAHLAKAEELSQNDGMAWSTGAGWDLSNLMPYLIPRYRASARQAALRASLAERNEPMLLMAMPVSWMCLAYAVGPSGPSWNDSGAALVAALILGLLRLNDREAERASSLALAEVSRGLGWNLATASIEPSTPRALDQ